MGVQTHSIREYELHFAFPTNVSQIDLAYDANDQIEEFSVHADSEELLKWFTSADSEPKCVYTVHGESDSAGVFANLIKRKLKWNVQVPKLDQVYELA